MKTRFSFTLLFFILFCSNVFANTYPIATSLQLNAPGLLHLDEAAIKNADELQFKFVLEDAEKQSMEVRLQLTIAGEGIMIQTSDAFKPAAILAYHNVPIEMTGSDLVDYFKPENLSFIGISKEQFIQNGQLPQGAYSVCLEVLNYDPAEESTLSEIACANEMSIENDPPVLLSPIGKQERLSSQFYNFIWQTRHMGGFPVEYELFIYEKIKGLSDHQIVNITPPVFRTKTLATSYLYTPANPILRMNQEYLVLVQVKNLKGQLYFKNNGKSKIETFIIVPPCIAGESCDDGRNCTYNDRIVANCKCEGTPYYDPNQDGICDPLLLPAPLIVFPDTTGNCIADGTFTTLWKPQHQYDLAIDYEFNLWQTGVDPDQTQTFQQLAQTLQNEKSIFLKELENQKNNFENQQEQALDLFNIQLSQFNEECDSGLDFTKEKWATQQLSNTKAFESALELIASNCSSNPKEARAIFQSQLAKERNDFKLAQQEAIAHFDTQLKAVSGAFQQKELEAYVTQMESEIKTDCSSHESYAQFFETQKTALKETRRQCLIDAGNYKNEIKKQTKEALRNIKEEISILDLAGKLAKKEYEKVLKKLEEEITKNLTNASSEQQKIQLQNAHEEALILAQNKQEQIIKALDEKKQYFQTEQTKIKTARSEDLKNADQTIAKLKRQCKTNYRKALILLQNELKTAEEHLNDALDLIQQDSINFAKQQEEEWLDFKGLATDDQKTFENQQTQEQNEFQTQQNKMFASFDVFLKEREDAFENQLGDCEQLARQQKRMHSLQQGMAQNYFDEYFNNRMQACQQQASQLVKDFQTQQLAEQTLFGKEQSRELQLFDNKQNNRKTDVRTDLSANAAERKIVFTSQTNELFQQLTTLDFELETGYQYELQVKASDRLKIAQFENGGFSNWWPLNWTICETPTTLNAPIALAAKQVYSSSFIANWIPQKGVKQYLLEVATDATFTKLVPELSGVLVEGQEYNCNNLKLNTHCYRVRSMKDGLISDYSNIICSDAPESCIVGELCDDKDACTYADSVTVNCDCVGIYSGDTDEDEVCDLLDLCPGGDDNVDVDEDGVPDYCDDCIEGTPCDDGNYYTINDVYIVNPDIDATQPPPPGVDYCLCQGTPLNEIPCEEDSDEDGVCDAYDICPNGNDAYDQDGDGVPDACDICPQGDDHEDKDDDGIPDACDSHVGTCDSEMVICPEIVNVEHCDYTLSLNNPDCYLFRLDYYLPNSTTIKRLKASNNPGGIFHFDYCTGNPCDGSPIYQLVEDLNTWFSAYGYDGEAIISSFSFTGSPVNILIKGTNLKFVRVRMACNETNSNKRFKKTNCTLVETYSLSPTIIGDCENPSYSWSTGANTPSINVPIESIVSNYSVVVNCADECSISSVNDYACEVGTPCDDYDPCTVEDVYNQCCVCIGEPAEDTDGDGVCDPIDHCPGQNDYDMPDENGDGIPDNCEPICNVGRECDDGDPCTVYDTYLWSPDGSGQCICIGEGPFDSDGDFVCDPLDQCEGHPDYADTDLDGIPDGCDDICFSVAGVSLNYCEAIQSIAACLEGPQISDGFSKLQDMAALSQFYFQQVINDPDMILEGDITTGGTPTTSITLEGLSIGDIGNATGAGFNVNLIALNSTTMADRDGDGVCDLFDICYLGDDKVDNNFDGIPDACAGCNFPPPPVTQGYPNYQINFGLYLQYKFDRSCVAPFVQADGTICNVSGELNCACECVPLYDNDVDNDGYCDDNDNCIGGNNNYDVDNDGIPNACDNDDPCDLLPSLPCPAPGLTCILGGYLQYNDELNACECITIPDGDDDNDGVCNSVDKCPGFDDEADIDSDGIPDACDLCPNFPGTISQACVDGSECSTNDVIVYTYNTEPLVDLIGQDYYSQISDPFDIEAVIQFLKDEEVSDPALEIGDLASIYNNLENIQDVNGMPLATSINGCECQGFEFDSDYDGVCDAMDLCPGFDDMLDYDLDGIPDACDLPLFDIGCATVVEFLVDDNYSGILLTFPDPTLDIAEIPSPVDFTFNNIDGSILYNFELVPITNFQNLPNEGEGITRVLYEIPINVDQVYQYDGKPTFWGEIAYSNGQYCYVDKGVPQDDGPSSTTTFACPSEGYFFSKNKRLAIGLPFDPVTMINRNSLPSKIESHDIIFEGTDGEVTLGSGGGTFVNESFVNLPPNILLLTTEISVHDEPFGLNVLTNAMGSITFDNGLTCEYDGGNPVSQCNNQFGIAVYIGQPCDDFDPLTHEDRYVLSTTNNCVCQGQLIHDEDNDGVHDDIDICPGGDDNVDVNNNSIPDFCECATPVVASTDYGDGIPVENIQIQNGNNIQITLEENPAHESYAVTCSPSIPAESINVTNNIINLSGLTPGGNYSITITATCSNGGYLSDPLTISSIIPDQDFTCSIITPDAIPQPCTNIDNLFVGDMVIIGDFNVTISNLTNISTSSTFSGNAYVSLPYYNGALIEFEFTDITIQECGGQYYVTSGFMQVPQDGDLSDILDDIIGNFDPFDGNLLDDLETALEVLKTKVNETDNIDDYNNDIHDLATDIADLLPDMPFMEQHLVDALVAATECMAEIPSNTFEDCKTELCAAISDLLNHLQTLYDADYQVLFYKDESQVYGFDEQKYEIHDLNYEQIEAIANDTYSVSWKSVRSGETDVVNAKKKDGTGIPDITFKNIQGDQLVPNPITDGHAQITVTGLNKHGAIQEIYAVQTITDDSHSDHNPDEHVHIAGKLNVVSYDNLDLDVRIVPVNMPGYSVPVAAIQTKLEDAFNQAGVDVSVGAVNNIQVNDFDNEMDDVASGFLSAYSPEQQTIINEFANSAQYQDGDVHYVFLIQSHQSPLLRGYMPKNRSFGFVFLDNMGGSNESLGKTIAHEVGHGAFILSHTHEDYPSNPEETLENKNNLMDYSDQGINLYKYQWDFIHDPASNNTLFDSDEEAESLFGVFAQAPLDLSGSGVTLNGSLGCKNFRTDRGRLIEFTGDAASIYNSNAEFFFDSNNNLNKVVYNQIEYRVYYILEKLEKNNKTVYKSTSTPFIASYPSNYLGTEATYEDGSSFNAFTAGKEIARLELEVKECLIEDPPLQAIKNNGSECFDLTDCPSFLIYDYTEENIDLDDLEELLGGEQSIEDLGGPTRHTLSAFLVLSKHGVPDSYQNAKNKVLAGHSKIWLHKDEQGQWTIPTDYSWISSANAFFDLDPAYSQESLLSALGSDLLGKVRGIYEFLDMVSKGLDKIKIPKYVYDDLDPKYDPKYGNVYYFLTLPFNGVIADFMNEMKGGTPSSHEFLDIGNLSGGLVFDFSGNGPNNHPPDFVKYQFAFICGTWNGALDIFKAVPDLLKWFVGFNAELDKAKTIIAQIKQMEFKDDNGNPLLDCETQFFWCFTYMIMDQFNFSGKPCEAFHNTAGIVLGIVAAVASGGAAAGAVAGSAGKVLGTILKVLNRIDDLTDIFGLGMKVVRRGLNKVYFQINKDGTINKYATLTTNGNIELILANGDRKMIPKEQFEKQNFIVEIDGTIKYKEDIHEFTLTAKKQGLIDFSSLNITAWKNAIDLKIKVLFDRLHAQGKLSFDNITRKFTYTNNNGQNIDVATLETTPNTTGNRGEFLDTEVLTDNNLGNRTFEQHTHEGDVGIACDGNSCKTYICGCFATGTMITTSNGQVANEAIQMGQTIIGYDEEKQDTVVSKVVRLIQSKAERLKRLFIQGKPLDVTEGHPVYVPIYKRYLPADSLRKGMKLLALSGALLTIDSTQVVYGNVSTYDFEVANVHNYYVGDQQVLVHNSSCNTRLHALGFNADQIAEIKTQMDAFPNIDMKVTFLKELENTQALKTYFQGHPNPGKATEAWGLFAKDPETSPDIRKDPVNLGLAEEILENKGWTDTDFTFEQVRVGINKSNSKANMLVGLKEASSPEGFEEAMKVAGRAIDFNAPSVGSLSNLFSSLPDLTQATQATKDLVEAARIERKNAIDKQTKIVWSEELAERRVDQVMEAKGISENGQPYQKIEVDDPPGIFPGKQGKFDRIYKGHDGTIYVVEAKGGTSTLGSRQVDIDGQTKIAQQGTEEYLNQIIDIIEDKLGPSNSIVVDLRMAKASGQLKYVYIKQAVTNLDNLVDPVVKNFPL